MPAKEVVISADSHVNVPNEDWAARLPAKYKSRAPRVEKTPEGDVVVFEGKRTPLQGLAAMAGRDPRDFSDRIKETNARAGGWDPNERMKDQDIDGVAAEVLYGGGPPGQSDDIPFRFELYKAYNDWLADFCKAQPKRLFGIGFVPIFEIEGAIAELKRIKKLGHVGAVIPTTQNIKPWGDPYWDPLWRTAVDMDFPMHFHAREGITVGGAKLPYEGVAKTGAWLSIGATTQFHLAAELLWSGLYERFPKLRLGHIEGNVGWIPYMLERCDQVFERHRFWTKATITTKPSEQWHRNCFASFIVDHIGVQVRKWVGVDNFMWSSDYPHSDTSWPDSKKGIETMFAGVPKEDREKILAKNAVKLYHLPY
jgi:predicted TIM-barrel fold metal-dependent hydrolase